MFLEINNASYIEDYKIELQFNNGETWLVDLQNELNGTVFTPLKDKSVFRDFSIVFNTIEWRNGADKAIVTIEDGIVKGEMPQRALKMTFDWLEIHRVELS